MSTLRRFEKRLEKIFEGPFTKLFKGGVQPLEIARRLMREADDGRVLGVNETLAPNYYQVNLSPEDYERLMGYFDKLRMEMEGLIINHINEKGYQLITGPQVRFQRDHDLKEGELSILASIDNPKGAQAPAAPGGTESRRGQDAISVGVLTILEGDGAGYSIYLEGERTRIGRSDENDLVLQDPRASRFHAEIERRPEGYVLRDLESTNGTMVGDRRISERLLEDGDTLTMGETEMRFGLVAGRDGNDLP